MTFKKNFTDIERLRKTLSSKVVSYRTSKLVAGRVGAVSFRQLDPMALTFTMGEANFSHILNLKASKRTTNTH